MNNLSCCEDCCDQRPLASYGPPLVPNGATANLCQACADIRRAEQARGEEPRPIGLTPTGDRTKWVDLPDLLIRIHSPKFGLQAVEIPVRLKYRRPTVANVLPEDGGEIKALIGNNSRWIWVDYLSPEIFGFNPHHAAGVAELNLTKMAAERYGVPYLEVSLA